MDRRLRRDRQLHRPDRAQRHRATVAGHCLHEGHSRNSTATRSGVLFVVLLLLLQAASPMPIICA
eukprot:6205395-Pleurochrysis_carterae.AAC.3